MGWFWKSKSKKKENDSKQDNSFLQAVHYHMVDRRQYARVTYPTVGALGNLPGVEYNGHFMDPVNISLGGILLFHPDFEKAKIGDIFEFKLNWRNRPLQMIQEAVLVRIHEGRWHFRFTKTDRRFFAEFPRLFRSGIRGSQTVEFRQNQIPNGEHILEFWMSESGDFLMFQKFSNDQQETITASLDGCRCRYYHDRGMVVTGELENGAAADPISREMIDEFMIFFANFKHPSPRVKKLITDLVDRYYRNAAAA